MKNISKFSEFSEDAKVWIYAFDHELSDVNLRIVEDTLNGFLQEWHAHNVPVVGEFTLEYNRFAILCADSSGDVSGCSIDSSVRVFKLLQKEHGLNALNYNLIHYRDDRGIQSVERSLFQNLVDSGAISQDTVVFNTTVQTLGEIRQGLWETKFCDSWHGQAFKMMV